MRFRLHNSSYRGLRFSFRGTTKDSYKVFLLLPLLALVSLYGLAPFAHQRFKRVQHNNSWFGETPFHIEATVGMFYKLWLKALGLIVLLGLLAGVVAGASFSGLGLNLGATNCEFSVIHCGRELARCTIAGQLAELSEAFPLEKQLSEIGETEGRAESMTSAWERNCTRIVGDILTEARESLVSEGSIRLLQQPVSIACAGGITQSEGFANLFQKAWNRAGWPIRIGQTRLATNPHFAIARGGLIKAILESQSISERRVA